MEFEILSTIFMNGNRQKIRVHGATTVKSILNYEPMLDSQFHCKRLASEIQRRIQESDKGGRYVRENR